MEIPSGEDQVKSGIEIKRLDAKGAGLARIATLSAVDGDGDTYAPGVFGEQAVKVLAAHDWTTVPIGKARIFEDGDEALAEFQLNLDSPTAAEWHAALMFDLDAKRSGGRPLQEWSYGFQIIDAEPETRDGERVRVLKRLKVHEISPVVLGAGVGTATLALKAGRPFREQIAAVKAAVEEVAVRGTQVARLRAEDGREMSAERRKQLDELAAELEAARDELAEAKAAIGALLQSPDPGAAGRELARTTLTLSRKHLPRRSRSRL